jgi:predicted nucleic acid-binding protein
MVIRAARLSSRARISFWDALLVRSAVESGCRELLSEDLQDGWVVDGLEVVSPFRA